MTQGRGYRIRGTVLDRGTGKGVAGLRVEAWDRDLVLHDLVGSATTGAGGRFEIRFGEERRRPPPIMRFDSSCRRLMLKWLNKCPSSSAMGEI